MNARFLDLTNHLMYDVQHTPPAALAKISKPGVLNLMYGKNHSAVTKLIMSDNHLYPAVSYTALIF
jgi:hypothetical protein